MQVSEMLKQHKKNAFVCLISMEDVNDVKTGASLLHHEGDKSISRTDV